MASRKEQKERLKAERLQREAEEQAKHRRQRLIQVGSGVAFVVICVVAVVLIVSISGGGSSGPTRVHPGNSVPAAAEVGVQTTPPPWQPEYAHLTQRLDALGLPALNENIFHIHALIDVYVNGNPITVPANIGLNDSTPPFSSIHTHDTSGVIHMEADKTYPFTIGQFFAVWGVKFSDDQLGPYRSKDNTKLSVYVNGKRVSDPVNQVMQEHDVISVGYGKPGSFPTKPPGGFPAGL